MHLQSLLLQMIISVYLEAAKLSKSMCSRYGSPGCTIGGANAF